MHWLWLQYLEVRWNLLLWSIRIKRYIIKCTTYSVIITSAGYISNYELSVTLHTSPSWVSYVVSHDDVIKWKHFPRYWPFVRGIHRSPVNSPHKGQWCGALMFSLICTRINGWANNLEAVDLRCHRAYYDVSVIFCKFWDKKWSCFKEIRQYYLSWNTKSINVEIKYINTYGKWHWGVG